LVKDIQEISEVSRGKIILGEFGVPIPDIHGQMDDKEQSEWIERALGNLTKENSLLGVNYWVSFGGTTAVFNGDGSERKAVKVLKDYFSPIVISGKVINEIGQPIEAVLIKADSRQVKTNEDGEFEIVSNPSLDEISLSAREYQEKVLKVNENNDYREIILKKEKEGTIFRVRKFFHSLVKGIGNMKFIRMNLQ
jgi:hypothetical protein